jgi:hypothetical protein
MAKDSADVFEVNAASLATIHEHLRDPHGLAQYHAFVFVGEISRMETLHQHRCRAGIEEKLEYRVSLEIIEDSGETFHADISAQPFTQPV